MKKIKYLTSAAIALALVACNNEEDIVQDGPVAAQISAGVSRPETRAIDNQWEQDEIGVMVTDASNSNMEELYKNVKYTTTADKVTEADFTSTDGIFFQDASETVTFAAYGPYQSSADKAVLPGESGVIKNISTDKQNTRDAQKKFDFIYATGATASRGNPTVEFSKDNSTEFKHKMTRLIFIVKTSTEDGFAATDVTSGTYSVSGLNHKGEFNVTTGTAQATGTETSADWSLTQNSLKDEETAQVTFTSILYPQTLTNSLVFKAVINGQTYTSKSEIKPTLAASTSYTYTLTIKKEGVVVSGCTVSGWSTGSGGDISVEM